jgi:hypothetical protein
MTTGSDDECFGGYERPHPGSDSGPSASAMNEIVSCDDWFRSLEF